MTQECTHASVDNTTHQQASKYMVSCFIYTHFLTFYYLKTRDIVQIFKTYVPI